MKAPVIVPCGDDALRLVMRATEDRQAIARALHGSRIWDEVVIGRESVTVQFDPSARGPAKALAMLKQAAMADINAAVVDAPNLKLLVRSDEANAPDLADCAAANNCSSNEFLNILVRSNLSVDMLGFAPGFAYLSGVDPNLLGGRLDHPRQRVKAGSIGFIKGYLGIYALDGPGGWPIIGRTDAMLFDKTARDPFVLSPGAEVQIEWV